MSTLLVFLQTQEGAIPKAALSTLAAAVELKKVWGMGRIVTVCLGIGAQKGAEAISVCGVDEALWSSAPALEKYLPTPYAEALFQVMQSVQADALVAAGNSTGKDCLPRVAAKLEAGQASDIIGIEPNGHLKRPLYAGNVIGTVSIETQKKIVTVRPTAFPPSAANTAAAPVKEVSLNITSGGAGEFVSLEVSGGERPELSDASVVVSGGRALQSSENFEKFVFPLADALGAAVGASRAAVDSGYAPNDWQVGQTGKVVAPQLYIAVGISGAIQHLAGMKDSKVIVAINKDPEAPIYEVADYGLVADLFQVLPELTEGIKKIKSS